MREHGNASLGALLGLSMALGAGCAEQHDADSSQPASAAADTRRSGDAPPPNPPIGSGPGTATSQGTTPDAPSAGMPAPTPPASTPVPGATPSATSITLPEPEPFDPMRTSCGSPRASEGVWLAFSALNHSCKVDADCFVSAGAVSCSKECARGSLNVAERANVERWFSMVEDKYCAPYRAANCPLLAPADCSSEESLPRCRDGYCSSVSQHCAAGCAPERPGGACRGAESCDGCPSVIGEADGLPCSKPGQSCTLDTWCSPVADCKDDKEPGVFRWVLFVPLC